MKAIILAAGMGTRLGTSIPKPLTPLKGEKTIMDYQIEMLQPIVGLKNIIIVVGYKKELIMKRYPEVMFVHNANYATTNTSKSLLYAFENVHSDLIFLNGDIFFQKGIIEMLLKINETAFLVKTTSVGEEEVKYNLSPDGSINELSKSVLNPMGEALGINYVRKENIAKLTDELRRVNDKDYFEKAFENLIKQKKIKVVPADVGDMYVKEIDFNEDLIEVIEYIKIHRID